MHHDLDIIEDVFEWILEALPYYDAVKLVFVIWLMFFNGAYVVFEKCIEPHFASPTELFNDKLAKLNSPELRIYIESSDGSNQLRNDSDMLIRKYGKAKFDDTLALAVEKENNEIAKKRK